MVPLVRCSPPGRVLKNVKIALVAGTRPEVIKMAPLYAALNEHAIFEPVWISTEQQAQLNSQTLEIMGVTPDLRLQPPSEDRSVGGRFAEVMSQLDLAFGDIQPDMVLVQGDTSSTAAGAMAAFARQIPIGHVEAGLRTFDLGRPFPEEGWRSVIGQLAAVNFAPTEAAAANLRGAGVASAKVHVTGNTGIDSVRRTGMWVEPAPLTDGLRRVLVTLHRRENWERGLEQVLAALIDLRDQIADIEFVFVAHANPDLRQRVAAFLGGQSRIEVIEPLDYPGFIAHLQSAVLILSDSGGVQEEAPVFGMPVLVLRESTERMEAVDAGVARLVGVSREAIVREAAGLLTDEAARQTMVKAVSPFGDGYASGRIVEILETVLMPTAMAAPLKAVC